MGEYALLKLAHIVGFAYWLGTDLGVFYSSYFVANDGLSADVRAATARILLALDLAPRICMTLMLPLGLHLAWQLDTLPIGGATLALAWVLCLAWLGMVLFLHFASSDTKKASVTKFDFGLRILISTALIFAGIAALSGAIDAIPYWIAWKLLIFGGLVGCGLIIRIRLRDFGPAFANVAKGQASDLDNAAIRRSLGGTRPFVIAIWIGLLASAALGTHVI